MLLPDHDGTIHGDLSAERRRVAPLCDRRAGIGADGVLRVRAPRATRWFMDYRNADGSVSEMCGNGIRVFVRHLVDEGLVDAGGPIDIGTRDGVKTLLLEGDLVTVDLGRRAGAPRDQGDDRGDELAGHPRRHGQPARGRVRRRRGRPWPAST